MKVEFLYLQYDNNGNDLYCSVTERPFFRIVTLQLISSLINIYEYLVSPQELQYLFCSRLNFFNLFGHN